jgi:hypothetical protein
VTLYIEENYRDFATLTKNSMDAGRGAKLVVRAQARLDDVTVLAVRALNVIRDGGAYSMTRGNLTHLTGVADPTLDLIKARDKTVYADTLKRLDEYLKLDRPRYTISKRGNLDEIVNDVAERQTEFVETVIAHSHPDCTIQDISSVGDEAWAALASGRRFPPTIENLATYVAKRSVDDHLATLLGTNNRITEPGTQAQARQVTITVLGASDVIPDPAQRVGLVMSISLDPPLARGEVAAEEGELTGLLLEAGVIPDPATLEATIARSKAYATFMTPTYLPVATIPAVISSMRVPRTVKQAIIDGLDSYTAGGGPDVFQAIAQYSVDNGLALTADRIGALITSGAQIRTMVALIACSELSPAEVQRAVHQLRGDYALISWYGTSKPVVDADEDHLNILSRLQEAGVVSSYTEEPDGKHVRVHLHHREPGT